MDLWILLILIFSGLGILNTLYLSYHAINKTDVFCLWFPPEWCKKVQHSPQSKLMFGIPNAFLGLGMYVGIFVLTWLFLLGTVPFWPIAFLVGFGFLFSTYFMYVQAYVLRAYCTWCVLSAVDFLILFIAVFFLR